MVRRLRAAGAIVLGKTNLPELAICGFTETKAWGITRNPWDTRARPAGRAAARRRRSAAGPLRRRVRRPTAPARSGSPRRSAGSSGSSRSATGSRWRPSREHWHGLSVTGCVTRTVEDSALWLDVCHGGVPGGPPLPDHSFVEAARAAPRRLRIAWSTKPPRLAAPPSSPTRCAQRSRTRRVAPRQARPRGRGAGPGLGPDRQQLHARATSTGSRSRSTGCPTPSGSRTAPAASPSSAGSSGGRDRASARAAARARTRGASSRSSTAATSSSRPTRRDRGRGRALGRARARFAPLLGMCARLSLHRPVEPPGQPRRLGAGRLLEEGHAARRPARRPPERRGDAALARRPARVREPMGGPPPPGLLARALALIAQISDPHVGVTRRLRRPPRRWPRRSRRSARSTRRRSRSS